MKTTHKIFIVILATMFIFAACVPALATNNTYTAYISGTIRASAGGNVECTIVMKDVAISGGILAFSATVSYDESILEFDRAASYVLGAPTGWATDIEKSVKMPGTVIVSVNAETSDAFDKPITSVSTLITKLVFKVKSASVESTEIKITETEAVNFNIEGVTGKCTSMTVAFDGVVTTTTSTTTTTTTATTATTSTTTTTAPSTTTPVQTTTTTPVQTTTTHTTTTSQAETPSVQTTSSELQTTTTTVKQTSESSSETEKQYIVETTEAKKNPFDKSGKLGIIIAAVAVLAVAAMLVIALGMKKKR